MKRALFVLGLLACPLIAVAQPRKVDTPHAEQTIGSWLLSCIVDPMTDSQQCRMRDKLWVLVPDSGHPGLALEVIQRFDQLVPALVARNITFNTALGGLLTLTATAQIRFDTNPLLVLPCTLDGTTVICAPAKGDAGAAADQLAKAHTVLIRLRPIGNLPLPMPDEPLALDLEQTPEALARYRVAGPATEVSSGGIGQDIKGLADQVMRRIGLGGPDQPGSK